MLRLRFARLDSGRSQSTIAKLAHINRGQLGLIERGRLQPEQEQLDALSAVLGVPPDALMELV